MSSSKENLLTKLVYEDDTVFPTYDLGVATWISKNSSSNGSVHNLNSINEPLNVLALNGEVVLPPINKSPLPVHDALYDWDAELEMVRFDLDDSNILSKPASYFFTNKS